MFLLKSNNLDYTLLLRATKSDILNAVYARHQVDMDESLKKIPGTASLEIEYVYGVHVFY